MWETCRNTEKRTAGVVAIVRQPKSLLRTVGSHDQEMGPMPEVTTPCDKNHRDSRSRLRWLSPRCPAASLDSPKPKHGVPAACIAERILPAALRNWFFLASDCEEVRLGFNSCRAAETLQNCAISCRRWSVSHAHV